MRPRPAERANADASEHAAAVASALVRRVWAVARGCADHIVAVGAAPAYRARATVGRDALALARAPIHTGAVRAVARVTMPTKVTLARVRSGAHTVARAVERAHGRAARRASPANGAGALAARQAHTLRRVALIQAVPMAAVGAAPA